MNDVALTRTFKASSRVIPNQFTILKFCTMLTYSHILNTTFQFSNYTLMNHYSIIPLPHELMIRACRKPGTPGGQTRGQMGGLDCGGACTVRLLSPLSSVVVILFSHTPFKACFLRFRFACYSILFGVLIDCGPGTHDVCDLQILLWLVLS